MKLFSCGHCGNTVYFENVLCESCRHALGYDPGRTALLSLDEHDGAWTTPALAGTRFIYCANAAHGACNWLIPETPGGEIYCTACRHNQIIPPLGDPSNLARWQSIERAKKRLFYALIRLGLPLRTRSQDAEHGLAFRFLADGGTETERVMTGHVNGVITIAVAEADDAERESRRTSMNEPYRTLLGHFRHEIGHYFWDLLVAGTPALDRFRALFGDERQDYAEAIETYYRNGPPQDWRDAHISAYATCHPWEDFAETFAHYLHIIDAVEMAASFGLEAYPETGDGRIGIPPVDFDPYTCADMGKVSSYWIPLAGLLNHLNRAIGQADAYPFILTPPVIDKLAFVCDLIHPAPAGRTLTRA